MRPIKTLIYLTVLACSLVHAEVEYEDRTSGRNEKPVIYTMTVCMPAMIIEDTLPEIRIVSFCNASRINKKYFFEKDSVSGCVTKPAQSLSEDKKDSTVYIQAAYTFSAETERALNRLVRKLRTCKEADIATD